MVKNTTRPKKIASDYHVKLCETHLNVRCIRIGNNNGQKLKNIHTNQNMAKSTNHTATTTEIILFSTCCFFTIIIFLLLYYYIIV